MLVLVTGASGYVGCHTVRAITAEGHRVRAFVRRPAKLQAALEPLGVDPDLVEVVVADATDPVSVQAAVTGVDAVVHTAAVYETSARFHDVIRQTNVTAARLVLDAAVAAGADPVVHVSSIVALMSGPPGAPIGPDVEPVAAPVPGAYVMSKADSDRLARAYQDRGAPVVITYPGAVMGPHDPSLGRNAWMLRQYLRGQLPVAADVTLAVTDVRDIGHLHARLLQPGLGPRRYLAAGDMAYFPDLCRAVAAAAHRRLPVLDVPVGLVEHVSGHLDPLNKRLPGRGTGLDAEFGWFLARVGPWHDQATRTDFGIDPVPAETSFTDTARWLAQTGHLTHRQTGSLLETPAQAALSEPRR
jgi:nucleoside-diphosphate-sugar epimerase